MDLPAGALVLALRRTSLSSADPEDDPELLDKLEDVLRHLEGDAVLQRMVSQAS